MCNIICLYYPSESVVLISKCFLSLHRPAKATKTNGAPSVAVPDNESSEPSHTVFVSELSWETTEDELKNHFKAVGKVVAAQILRKARRGKLLSTGNGLVQFQTVAEANNAISKLDGSSLGDREIKCRVDKKSTVLDGTLEEPLSPSNEKAKERVAVPNSVYVGNLAWSTTDELLAAHLSSAGAVKSANVRKSKSGRSLGNAVVEFNDGASAAAAIATLNDSEVDGRKISLREYFEK